MAMAARMPGGMAFGGTAKPMSEIVFDRHDKDKSGHIDAAEFQGLCFDMGYAFSPAEIAIALRTLDTDGSGKVEKSEFTQWWKKSDRWESLKLDDAQMAIRQSAADAFNEFDSKKTGSISTDDFDKFHKMLVEKKLTNKDKATCLADLDKNGDKSVQFAEYVEWLGRIGTISQKVMPVDAKGATKADLKPTVGGTKPAATAGGGSSGASGAQQLPAMMGKVSLKPTPGGKKT